MAFNIAQIGVDKKSGAPLIQRTNTFTYQGDPSGTRDIFYYFGSRLRSSTFVNPTATEFIAADLLQGGSSAGSGANALDNSILTSLFTNSTDETNGLRVQFLLGTFVLNSIQINSTSATWTLEASNNGTSWTPLTLGTNQNLGNNWLLHTVTNSTAYSYYRLLHGETGIPKTLTAVKFFGTYSNPSISIGIEDEATILGTHADGPAIIYLPDATAQGFPDNYYAQIAHIKDVDYTFAPFAGGTTPINDNTNGSLRGGEQLFAVYEAGAWELYKIGAGVDLSPKGSLLSHDGTDTAKLTVGTTGQFLRVNPVTTTGLEWDTVNLNEIQTPTSNFNFGGYKLTNLGEPTSLSDAVTKAYADSIAAGFDPKQSCEVATTTDLNTETGLTWTPSGSGVGKTLTSNGASAIIDGVTLVNGYRVLVKNQPTASDNGIFLCSNVGSAVTLTRTTDFNNSTNVTPGAFTFITGGSTNISTGYLLLGTGTITVDTTALNFTQFVGTGSLSFNSLNDVNVGSPNASNDQQVVGWNNSTGQFELLFKPGTQTGNLVQLEDVGGNPGLPAVDGTQITLNSSQVYPFTAKGDLWTFNGTSDLALPAGSDNQILASIAGETSGLKWKTISSTDLTFSYTASDIEVNFTTGTNTIELGPLHIDDSLSPNDDEFLRYDTATNRFIAEDPTGTDVGDIVVLQDVAGNPGLPAVDGSNLTNLTVASGQGSPLTTKGDVYVYSTGNTRLPVGADDLVLTADSTTPEGLVYKEVIEPLRKARKITTSPYIITSADERQVVEIENGSVIELQTNIAAGFFTIIKSAQLSPITFIATNGGSITQNGTIYNEGDIAIVHTFNGIDWTISILSNNILINKGELLGFSNKPEVLTPGTNGQVLTVSNVSPIGLRWESKGDATDLIYTKEIPTATLNHIVNDIFEYIGRDRDITFTNAFTNPVDGVRIIANTNTTFGILKNDIVALTDQSNGSNALQLQQNGYGEWFFQTVTIQPYEIAIYHQANPSDTNWDVQVSNNGTSWTTVGTLPANGSIVNSWVTTSLTTNGYYSYLRVINTTSGTELWANEVKLFGWVKDNPAKGDLIVNNGSDIVSLPVGSNGQILEADNAASTGIKWASKPLSPTTKGDLITYNTTPTLLPAGSDGQVLTVASATPEGIQWAELGGLKLTETKYITTSTIDRFYSGGSIVGQNGVINYIGTDGETVAYSNVVTDNEVDIFLNSVEQGPAIFDKNYSTNAFTFGASSNVLIDLKRENFIRPTHLGISANVNSQSRQLLIEASNNGVSWEQLANIAHATTNGALALTTSNFFRYIRLTHTGTGGNPHNYRELEIYGGIIPINPTYNIVDADNNKLLLVPFSNPTQVNIPTGVGANGFTCQITATVSGALPITINPLPGVTFIGQNFTIDNVGEVATIYQVATNTYVVSISRGKLPLNTKGDLLTHDGSELVVQNIGADDTVLVADSGEASGIAWKNVNSITSSPFTSQRINLTGTLQLTGSSARYLYLNPQGNTYDVILTDPPFTNDFFYIVNRTGNGVIQIKETSAGSIEQTLTIAGDHIQAHYDGVEWQYT